MKKLIIAAIVLIVAIAAVVSFRGMQMSSQIAPKPTYQVVEDLNGIGCLRIGMTSSEAKKVLDSLYSAYSSYLKKNYNSIDYVRIKRNEMLKLVEPLSYKAPSSYTPNHTEYEVTLIFSEDFAVERVKAYFWSDTLYRIHVPNSVIQANEIGEGLITKYGDGIGYYDKNSNTEDQVHRWGNDHCIATYRGKTTYNLNSQGLASGVASWFHEVEIIKNDLDLTQKIENYLHQADSLWQVDRYKNI